jgi:hypothetical protein
MIALPKGTTRLLFPLHSSNLRAKIVDCRTVMMKYNKTNSILSSSQFSGATSFVRYLIREETTLSNIAV